MHTKVLMTGDHWFDLNTVHADHTFDFTEELDDNEIKAIQATLNEAVFQTYKTIHIDCDEDYENSLDEVITPLMLAGTVLKS